MASSTIRKAIGAVKDQTSISIAKVAGNAAPHIEVLVVKATSHDEEPADEKYFREIVSMTLYSREYVSVCMGTISKRLSKTHDWIVALKALMLVHRLLVDGHPQFEEEIVYATRSGMRVLNMSGFRDEAHSNSWDHSGFVRFYAMYLDEKVELVVFERKLRDKEERVDDRFDGFGRTRRGESGFRDDFEHGMRRRSSSYGDVNESLVREQKKESTPIREMRPEKVLGKLGQLLRILDRVLACRPAEMAKDSRLVFVAFYHVVKESFGLYVEICEALGVLLDRFTEMEYENCVRGFDVYVTAAKLIDDLIMLYDWCKDVGIARSSEFPEVKRVTVQLLGTLEGFLKEMSNRGKKSPERIHEEKAPVKEEQEINMNEVKALPAPENHAPPHNTTPPEPQQSKPQPQQVVVTEDLVNLKDDVLAKEQGNKLALALFSGQTAANANGAWETFPSNGEPEVTSAWQTPAAETGKADWELALAESASNLSKQKAMMGGDFDPLLLNGMYDQGAVRQHLSNTQLSGGSSSSVALPGLGKSGTAQVLALPAPDGSLQPVGNQDPFAASLLVPPPSYVQMAEMERKQQLLVQEQQIWQQHGTNGMQGQVGYYNHGMVQPGGYYSTNY